MTVIILLCVTAAVVLDQVFKIMAENALSDGTRITLIDNTLHFLYTQNTGAAFGSFKGYTMILGIISGIMIIIGIYIIIRKKIPHPLAMISIASIIAGGAGNFVDRIFRGYVIDYIYFSPINFPIFNFADMLVVCGTFLFAFYFIFVDKKQILKEKTSDSI